jgi:enterochelin esterase-like enzyme
MAVALAGVAASVPAAHAATGTREPAALVAASPGNRFSPQVTYTGAAPTAYTVTFRYYDPSASRVQVNGEWYFSAPQDTTPASSQGLLPSQWAPGDIPIAYPNSVEANWPVTDMTKDPHTGVWSYTTPLPSGTFTYGFFIDCASGTGAGCTEVSDPANPPWNDVHGVRAGSAEPDSQVYVPSDPAFGTVDYSWQAPSRVHGHLADMLYPSPESISPPGQHPLAVYTPPGYNPHRRVPYPTLYLSHGAGGSELDWSTQGAAGNILDHLVEAKLMQPVVVVMTNFYGLTTSATPAGMAQAYATDLLQDVIPYVQAHYDVSARADSRAFGGLSDGGAIANFLMVNDTDGFGYYSVMSNAGQFPLVPPPGELPPALVASLKRPAGIQIGGGLQDPIRFLTTVEEAELTASGVPFTSDSPNGGHEWYAWRILLRDFLTTIAFRATTTSVTAQTWPGHTKISATVRADTTEPISPAGTMQFYVDGATLGRPVQISAGTATLLTAQLSTGPHTITATYSGSTYYNPSTGAAG